MSTCPDGSPRQRPTGKEIVQRQPRWRGFAVMLLALLTLSACSRSTLALAQPSLPEPDPSASVDPAHGQVLRVIVKFRQSVSYRDAAFLQDMAQQINARITYLSSVSSDTHVYRLEFQPGLNHADILRRLSGLPAVLWVEADAHAQPF